MYQDVLGDRDSPQVLLPKEMLADIHKFLCCFVANFKFFREKNEIPIFFGQFLYPR